MRLKLVLLILLLFIACSKKKPVEIVEKPLVLVPLTVGNQWLYDIRMIDLNGVVDTAFDSANYTVVSQLNGLYTDYVAIEILTDFPISEDYLYWKNTIEGLWTLHPSTFETELFLPFPTSVGDSINWRTYTIKTISHDTMVTTETGDFSCLYYHLSNGDSSSSSETVHTDYFIAPNLGLIKQVGRIFNNNVVQSGSVRVLLDYQLVPDDD